MSNWIVKVKFNMEGVDADEQGMRELVTAMLDNQDGSIEYEIVSIDREIE